MIEKVIYHSNNKFIKLINLLFSIVSLIYLFSFNNLNFQNIQPKYEFLLVCILIVLMNVTLATCWSILYNDKFRIEVVSYWLISNIGKYVPFKLGLIPKRFIYSKIYSNNKSFSKFFIIEYLYMTLIFFILTLIGLAQLRFLAFLTVITIFFVLKKKINSMLVFLYTLAYFFNFCAISIFYYSNFEINSTSFALNYILSAVVGNLFIGSPAGIGIREAIFVNNPFSNFDGQSIVSIILTLRFLYICSDFISYLLGVVLKAVSK